MLFCTGKIKNMHLKCIKFQINLNIELLSSSFSNCCETFLEQHYILEVYELFKKPYDYDEKLRTRWALIIWLLQNEDT